MVALIEEVNTKNVEAAKLFEHKVQELRDEVERSSQETTDARALAAQLASELARIRRLAKLPVRDELSVIAAGVDEAEPSSASPTASTASTAPTTEPSSEPEPAALGERANEEPGPAGDCNDPDDTHEPCDAAPQA